MIPQLSARDPIGRPREPIAITSIASRAITQNDGTHWPSPARSHQPSFDSGSTACSERVSPSRS